MSLSPAAPVAGEALAPRALYTMRPQSGVYVWQGQVDHDSAAARDTRRLRAPRVLAAAYANDGRPRRPLERGQILDRLV